MPGRRSAVAIVSSVLLRSVGHDFRRCGVGVVRLAFSTASTARGRSDPGLATVVAVDLATDGPAIIDVIEASRTDAFRGPSPPAVLAECRSRAGRQVQAWLARHQGLPAGLATLVTSSGRGGVRHSIGWLLVGAGCRRAGVGTALVATAVARARRQGARTVWVETHDAWPGAVAFWEAIGFTIAGRT